MLTFYAKRFGGWNNHVPFLAPWWGEPKEDPTSLNLGQFAEWASAKDLPMRCVDRAEDADAWVLAFPWKVAMANAEAMAFARAEITAAGRAGKRIIIFFDSDLDVPVDWPAHAVVFRFSIYSDRRKANEFAIPTFSQDFLRLHFQNQLQPRPWTARPSVSFCGYAPPLACGLVRKTASEVLRYVLYRTGALENRRIRIAHAPRVHAIRRLRNAPQVEAKFVVRNQFAFNQWGVLQPGGEAEAANSMRREFVENLNGADYALCARGYANCSVRFYEALSLGRIPLYVNTHCVLPYEFCVNWKELCCEVDRDAISEIATRLARFHAELNPERFETLQRQCRAVFERWITPAGFFRSLPLHWIPDWRG